MIVPIEELDTMVEGGRFITSWVTPQPDLVACEAFRYHPCEERSRRSQWFDLAFRRRDGMERHVLACLWRGATPSPLRAAPGMLGGLFLEDEPRPWPNLPCTGALEVNDGLVHNVLQIAHSNEGCWGWTTVQPPDDAECNWLLLAYEFVPRGLERNR